MQVCTTPTLCDAVGACDCPEPTQAEQIRDWIARTPPAELLQQIRAERARRSLAEFFRQAFVEVIEPATDYEHGPHVDAICDHVQWQLEERARAVADRSYQMQCADVLINIPPRALKTIAIQVAAVAWAWLHWPHLRVLCLSTNPKVSTEAADACRSLIRSEWYQRSFAPEWQIRDDKDGVTNIANSAGGRRAARGWDANVVGEGADWRIIDDPDDPDDVHSEPIRESVQRRWRLSIANRKTDPRTTITTGIQQRVHVDDWSAHRVAEEGWIHVKLRQEYKASLRARSPMPVDASNRYTHGGAHQWQDWRTADGQTLHPRFTPTWCASERKRLGTLGFEAQHNQEPRLLDGNLFKRSQWKFFRYDDDAPVEPSMRPEGCNHSEALTLKRKSGFEWLATTTDATFGKSATSDFVSVLVVAGIGSRIFVLADLTLRRNFPETQALLEALGKSYPFASHLIEAKANGQAIIDTLSGRVPGLIALTPEGGKESRASACSPRVEAGDVYLHDGAAWLEEFIAELADFPTGTHDDRVDAFTQALIHFGSSPSVAAFYALSKC